MSLIISQLISPKILTGSGVLIHRTAFLSGYVIHSRNSQSGREKMKSEILNNLKPAGRKH